MPGVTASPQAVASGSAAPSAQTGAPVEQLITPDAQAFGFPLHAVPATHATHEPPLHTPPGQAAPVPTLPVSTQTAEPLEQLIVPVLQGLAGVHAAPALQALHEPALQTPPGHDVPFILLEPSRQTAAPVEQLTTPFLQADDGLVVQAAPSLQALQAPLRHAPPGHEVPFVLLLPSTHTALPLEQSMVPLRQAELGFVVQAAPAVQALQNPPPQTPPGQVVPFGFAAPSTHTALPVEQSMTPLRHAELGLEVHDAPALHATQAPALHTPPAHVVPFILFVPSVQTALPVEQLTTPFLQAVAFVVQLAPSLHALHAPLRHAPPEQVVPLFLFAPSTQAGVPLEQSTTPSLQAALGLVVHAAPAVHETHWSAALQTRLVPQLAPVPRRAPATQTGLPDVHAMDPVKHAFAGEHDAPAEQFAHAPPESQTWLVPQVVPGALLPLSIQRCAPVMQSVTPLRQSPGLVPHVVPAWQETHAPVPLQTRPAPHERPALAFAPSTHVVLPVLQSTTPSLHGALGLLEHACPATHAPQLPFASQTWPEPHAVPDALFVPSTQTEVPVVQLVMPLRHPAFGFVVHERFGVHMMQLPEALQT